MATLKLVLKQQERKTDRTHLVMFRVTQFRKAVYIGTNIYVPKKDWNPDGSLEKANWVLKKNPMWDTYNTSLKGDWQRLDKFQLEHPAFTAAQLKARYLKEDTWDLMVFFRATIKELQTGVAPATVKSYDTGFKHLETFTHGTLAKIDLPFLKRYEAELLKEHKRNSVALYLSQLRTLVKKAIAAGILPFADDPFHGFTIRRGKVHKDRLTTEELSSIIQFKTEGKTEQARRTFLVQFFLSGMRISDLLQLRWEQVKGDRLEYKSQKTGALLSVKIPPPALELMGEKKKGYIFAYLPEGVTGEPLLKRLYAVKTEINRELKVIATSLKIDKVLTTHVARHSFASLAWANSRDIKAVSQALGHTSVSMTENYLRELTHQEQDKLSDSTFKDFV